MKPAQSVYADHNATSPMLPEVAEAMDRVERTHSGNPSSVHAFGRDARRCLDRAREQVATLMGAADPSEIIFTSGGTEADNLALFGLAEAHTDACAAVVTTEVEHPAVLEPCRELARRGRSLVVVPVGPDGIVDPAAIAESLPGKTGVLSVMYVNNETGAAQPIAEIARIASSRDVPFHVDAVQAAGKIHLNVSAVPITTLAVSAHKIGGPKGVGALFVRRGTRLRALVYGGGQERGLRPGTENVAGAVGFGVAAESACRHLSSFVAHLSELCDELLRRLQARVPGLVLNSPCDAARRAPGTLNISFPGVDSVKMVLELDRMGICVSSGSACSSGSHKPSRVLLAQGRSPVIAGSAVRFSFGRENDLRQVDIVADAVTGILDRFNASCRMGHATEALTFPVR